MKHFPGQWFVALLLMAAVFGSGCGDTPDEPVNTAEVPDEPLATEVQAPRERYVPSTAFDERPNPRVIMNRLLGKLGTKKGHRAAPQQPSAPAAQEGGVQ